MNINTTTLISAIVAALSLLYVALTRYSHSIKNSVILTSDLHYVKLTMDSNTSTLKDIQREMASLKQGEYKLEILQNEVRSLASQVTVLNHDMVEYTKRIDSILAKNISNPTIIQQ